MTVPELQIINCRNYPNPFNPSTTIEFNLSTSLQESVAGQDVADDCLGIAIYNLKGQKIKELPVNSISVKDDDRFSAIWNGTDSENRPVSSGVYFYRISLAGKSEIVKKCILMK
jgi:flagellar hook assembly protein FlgD